MAKWDYSRALGELKEKPTVEFDSSSESILNETVLISEATIKMQSEFLPMFDHLEALQMRYM